MARDLMKMAICQKAGVTLITVHEEDLSLQAMLGKVKGHLPLSKLEGHAPLIDYLDKVGRKYHEGAERRRRKVKPT